MFRSRITVHSLAGATLITAPKAADLNGVIHVIDTVVPPSAAK